MPKTAGRPRDANPAATRDGILRAAEASFARLGFAGATTRQVAASAGVNVATLHYHFGSKEGLYRAVLTRAENGGLPSLPQGATLEETVRALVPELVERTLRRPSLSRLSLLDTLAGPGPGSPPREGARAAAVAAALGRHLPEAGGPARARATARALVALVDAALVSSPGGDGEGADGARLSEALTAAALELCAREP